MPARTLIAAAFATIALLPAALAQQATIHRTPDGHAFFHYPMPDAKRGAIAINWPSGLAGLPVGDEVISRIGVNLMLNGGAGDRTPDDLVADFEDLDAGAQLFVQPDQIRGFIVAPPDAWSEAAEIANDVLARPRMGQDWFERERQKLLENSRGRISFIWGNAWTLAREVMLGDHRTRNFWSLLPDSVIEGATLDQAKAWREAAFTTKGLEITAAGPGPVAEVAAAIDTALSGLPSTPSAPWGGPPTPSIPGATILYHAPKAEKSLILALGDLPPASAGQDHLLNLGIGVLGYGKQSRLFKAVRTSLRASYRYGAGFNTFTRARRAMQIGGEVDTELLAEALATTRETYEEYREDGIGRLEYPFAWRFYRDRLKETLKKPEEVAYLLMEARLDGLGDQHVETLLDQIEDIERSDVNAFVREAFPPFDDLLVIVVSPDKDAVPGACVITAYDQWTGCLR